MLPESLVVALEPLLSKITIGDGRGKNIDVQLITGTVVSLTMSSVVGGKYRDSYRASIDLGHQRIELSLEEPIEIDQGDRCSFTRPVEGEIFLAYMNHRTGKVSSRTSIHGNYWMWRYEGLLLLIIGAVISAIIFGLAGFSGWLWIGAVILFLGHVKYVSGNAFRRQLKSQWACNEALKKQ